MLYTRKGDRGTSGLFGTPDRLPKNSPVFEALGALDECNSLLGVCRAYASQHKNNGPTTDHTIDIAREVVAAQECLFIIQAELAGAHEHLTQLHIDALERCISNIEKVVLVPHSFVIPGTNELSALFDYARAVSRRAERAVIGASGEHRVRPETLAYLNRLSSLLYALARYTASGAGSKERSPTY